MNIYIVRHAEAEPAGGGISDFDRSLTTSGKERLKSTVKVWRRVIPSLNYIYTSPVYRAYQTASILKEGLGVKNEIISEYDLSMGVKVEKIIDLANEMNEKDLMFVGHQPDCGNHISALSSVNGLNVIVRPGTLAKISFDKKAGIGTGHLELLLPATMF